MDLAGSMPRPQFIRVLKSETRWKVLILSPARVRMLSRDGHHKHVDKSHGTCTDQNPLSLTRSASDLVSSSTGTGRVVTFF